MAEKFTMPQLNAWLDTPGGMALVAEHGSRAAAAAALEQEQAASRAWRHQQAADRVERYPDRWPTMEDAMRGIHDPVGGFAAELTGSCQGIAAAYLRNGPAARVRVIPELADGSDTKVWVTDEHGRLVPADTRAPHQRG
jgi:hypothetical protein